MLVDRTAYLLSLFHLLGAASILLILLPLYVWRGYLKTKSYTFRFVFAVLVQNTFLINLVLLLGFLGICNRVSVLLGMAALYIPVSWYYSDKRFFTRWHKRLEALMQVFHGNKQGFTLRQDIGRWFKERWLQLRALPFWRHLWHNLPEYLFLLAIVGYNIWFLSYNVLEYHSSQFSDIPVHHSWIYALDKGTLFVDGIYPFAMHAIIYLLHKLFFIDIREALLYFGVFQTVLLVLSIHFFSKAIFRWKYGAVVASTCFSLMLTQGRFAAALPQECGVFALVLIGWCLVRFFQTPLEKHTIRGDSPLRQAFRIKQYLRGDYLNTDALLFALATSLTIAYHFYTGIAASLLVAAFFIAYLFRMIKKQYWVPIILAGVLGTFIAVAPLMACYVKGIPFQNSIAWAMSVIHGETWVDDETNYLEKLEGTEGQAFESEISEERSFTYQDRSFFETLLAYYDAIYNFVRVAMLGEQLANLLMICLALAAAFGVFQLFSAKYRLVGAGYLALTLYVLLIGLMGAAEELGLVVILGASRSVTFAQAILFIAYAIPFELAFRFLSLLKNQLYQRLLEAVSIVMCLVVVWIIFRFGWVHDYFEVNLAYYNEPVYLIEQIKKAYPPKSFTVVSTVEEYYQIVDHGFHENLSRFVSMIDGNEDEYKLPTPYVFFFIEKQVLDDYFHGSVRVSPEYAREEFTYLASSQDYYFQRAIIESKAYYWALAFQRIYPNSFKVYFENDIYIAFMLKQNPFNLYNLQIDYLGSGLKNIERGNNDGK